MITKFSKTSDPSEVPFEDHSAPLAISPFYDDPYMKVMQAYNATSNESHIPPPQAPIAPPTILPPSPVFEIGESSHVTHLEHHKELIDAILNYLDELPLKRIEHMEDKIEGLVLLPPGFLEPLYPYIMDMINDQDTVHMIPPTPPRDTEPPIGSPISLSPSSSVGSSSSVRMAPKRTLTSAAPAMIQAAIRKLVANSVAAALEAQAATMVKKMEDEFYNLTMKENNLKTYVRRLQELAILCLTMVPSYEKLMEAINGGLPRSMEGNVTASKPQTLEEAITITQRLMDKKGHYRNQYPKENNNVHRRAYLLRDKNAHQNPNVVMGRVITNALTHSGLIRSFWHKASATTFAFPGCQRLCILQKTFYESLIVAVDSIVPAFMKELICRVLGLLVPLLESNRFGILLGEPEEGRTGPIDKVLVLQVQHQVSNRFGIPLVESVGDPTSP
nr:reverse transcriptase domain-containing protein [Tanacetum cinerariifolium]